MNLELKYDYLRLGNFRVIDVHEDKKWTKKDFPHFHYCWEIKFYKTRSHDYACTVVLPEIIHGYTPREQLETCWSLTLEKPNAMLMVFNEWDDNMHIIPFEQLDGICPGGLVKLLNKLIEIPRLPVNSANIERMINSLLGLLVASVNIALELVQKDNYAVEPLAERARRYIEYYYYRNDLSVQQVAKQLGVSSGHLAHVFKAENLGTVKEYIVRCRLKNALNLLKSGRYSVKEVAMMTGWNCQFYFSNRFRGYYGIPPSSSSKLPEAVYHLE